MRPEQAESLFVETLFKKTVDQKKIKTCQLQEIEILTGDASTRRYYRVLTTDISYVVCLDQPILESNDEYDFIKVGKALSSNGVKVPMIYDVDIRRGYILEEDLGNITLLQRLAEINDLNGELELYKPCIDLLTKIHSIKIDQYKEHSFTKLVFDQEKLMSEVLFSIKFFLRKFMKYNISSEDEATIVSSFVDICNIIAGRDKVFTHRDYHSRNLMAQNGDITTIDFQDARLGIPQYDLCSLLDDCYYNISIENVEKLKKYYWDTIKDKNFKKNGFDDFLYLYDLMMIQRIFKAIGSFSYIYALREDVRYIKYIGYSFEKMKRVLLKYPKYNNLRKILSKFYYAH